VHKFVRYHKQWFVVCNGLSYNCILCEKRCTELMKIINAYMVGLSIRV